MPEYLAPGVFVEEVSFRAKTIEGVPTSTAGFVGAARYGPVRYDGGPLAVEPRLITSFVEYERTYGPLDDLQIGGGTTCYLAHAARAFFLNGGRRLYVARAFRPGAAGGVASRGFTVSVGGAAVAGAWRARWPGLMGNAWVTVSAVRSKDVAVRDATGAVTDISRVREGSLVEVLPAGSTIDDRAVLDTTLLRVVHIDQLGVKHLHDAGGEVPPPNGSVISLVQLSVLVQTDGRDDPALGLSTHADSRRYVGTILSRDDPEDQDAVVWLDLAVPAQAGARDEAAIQLAGVLVGTTTTPPATIWKLEGGDDGAGLTQDDILGEEADPDDATRKATGLHALGEVDDVAIVAAPDVGSFGDEPRKVATDYLLRHAEAEKYRIAVVDGPQGASMNEIRAFRGQFDSKYGALYHPWIEILDPRQSATQGAPPAKLVVPPSGFVAGIYARTDIERGVWKAPANEVVAGLTRFEANINKPRQEVLNPEGINALRFFPGRGSRVWGARTLSSDPEWRYVNVRRYFIFIEHSLDKATQWVVFEPNNEGLWRNVTQTVRDFLFVQWRDGALLGATPDEAYFVRCDRTTMTQNDLDNGRLICLVGISPVRPAEFVIFRVGQWTADAS